jgi:hypothetical protein
VSVKRFIRASTYLGSSTYHISSAATAASALRAARLSDLLSELIRGPGLRSVRVEHFVCFLTVPLDWSNNWISILFSDENHARDLQCK